ncbi:ARF GTPase-activating protein GIT2 isoform X2 [Lingula anatina]|uniref:ARF GTPase-activating protein GIT2 isoform X2 n=1 Tax=Lingula anatina TaxID=7574 RepID=A0A1S3K2V6_LINAN|nr:ARF GTPase-activating protein GIT2 isoform X2 [Lingula anatina]|eukprot:XP_013416586.1 ARF GTPase-activating protein GIT2 isoform X2 [Lingula anatina]
MSRGKGRTPSEICSDCGAPDPSWASVNRGVLMCDECCSIHRSLGRHISHVKSLKKGNWHPTLLQMVHQLVSQSTNSIWEHTLLDPTQNKQGRRKPNPRDQLHPMKADFIRAKYQFLAFAQKPKDEENQSVEDLSKQLHSCVRTGNLETTLRLLSFGANPNYFHQERGNCPIHVAAQSGQATQVELVVIYGADPGAVDSGGKTAADYAKAEGYTDLSNRIVELQYELTDRLAYYLCGRKPDHKMGQHFIIPEMADSSLDLSELAKAAKKQLQGLPNHLFEELAMDVYDEVDRRENDKIWLGSQNHNALVSDRQAVPFLPVNPEFSSTRNQGRQKLARFNAREFATLIIDVLSDAKRRQQGITSPVHTPRDREQVSLANSSTKESRGVPKTSSFSDDEPVYDSVASDEDYSSIGGDVASLKDSDIQNTQKKEGVLEDACRSSGSPTSMISFTESMASSDQSDGPITSQDYHDLKRALAQSDSVVHQLMAKNAQLVEEVKRLHSAVQRLTQENATLQGQHAIGSSHAVGSAHILSSPHASASVPSLSNGYDNVSSLKQQQQLPSTQPSPTQPEFDTAVPRRHIGQLSRPQSMFEPRNHHRLPWQKTYTPFRDDNAIGTGSHRISEEYSLDERESPPRQFSREGNASDSDYDNANKETEDRQRESTLTPSPDEAEGAVGPCTQDGYEMQEGLPTQEQVVKKTEIITKKIQELLKNAQEGNHESYSPCADKILSAVSEMTAIFPQNVNSDCIGQALQQLGGGADRLCHECKSLPIKGEDGQLDYASKTPQVIQCAFDIAKAAKQLVTLFERA